MELTTATEAVRAGDRVLLWQVEEGRRYLVHLDGGGARKEKGLGVFDPARLEGEPWGAEVEVAGKRLLAVRPTPADLAATIRRKAQIIGVKDASRIVWELGLFPGARVLESGIGSGAVTIPLLAAVGPTGRVVSQELRQEFAEWAARNVAAAGLEAGLEVHLGDLTQAAASGVQESAPYDACLLDQPEPWLALPNVVPLLAPGARIACYCPQAGQMETTVRALRDAGFGDVRALELIERAWEVKERGARPAFEGLGHTGFLVFARHTG